MNKLKILGVLLMLAVPAGTQAAVEKIWQDPVFIDYPQGSPGFPVVIQFEPGRLGFLGDGTAAVVSNLRDLNQPPPQSVGSIGTYLVTADGNVTTIGNGADRSTVSADGSTIVYDTSGASGLFRNNAQNTDEQQIVANEVTYFSVDSTGSRVAYVRSSDVYTANIDGTGETMVHDTSPSADIEHLTIAGGGSKVIFIANPDGDALNPDPPNLFVVDFDGNNLLRLTDSAAEGAGNSDTVRGASITDDGNTVIFAKSWDDGIYMVDSDGNNPVQVFSLQADFPVISGDGSTIAFISSESSAVLGTGSESGFSSVYSFPVSSPNSIRSHIPFGLGVTRRADVGIVAISTTGQYVFYTSPEDFANDTYTRDFRDLYLYRSTGAAAGTTTGDVEGGIGTIENPDVTALDHSALALLALAALALAARRRRT